MSNDRRRFTERTEVPVAGGAFAVLTAPVFATVAAIGATLARVHLEIEREEPREEPGQSD